MAGTRIKWTEDEDRLVFNGTKDVIAQQKIKLPFTKVGVFMNTVRSGQIVLPEHRRRQLFNLDSLARMLPRFKEEGIIPEEFLRHSKRVTPDEKVDPQQARMNQLADERDAAVKARDDLLEQNQGLVQQALMLRRELQSVPTEAQVLKTFIADILADVQARGRALPGPSGEEINRIQREAAARDTLHTKKHNPIPASEDRPKKPMVLIVNNENQPVNVGKWQSQFPDILLREVDVRADGKVTIPMGAEDVVMIQGVRHATTAAVKEVYPNARLVMNLEVAKLLSSINERLKGAKHA